MSGHLQKDLDEIAKVDGMGTDWKDMDEIGQLVCQIQGNFAEATSHVEASEDILQASQRSQEWWRLLIGLAGNRSGRILKCQVTLRDDVAETTSHSEDGLQLSQEESRMMTLS